MNKAEKALNTKKRLSFQGERNLKDKQTAIFLALFFLAAASLHAFTDDECNPQRGIKSETSQHNAPKCVLAKKTLKSKLSSRLAHKTHVARS